MKYTTIGILAHVDAGKTTTCEMFLYNLKKIKDFGRVDKGNAFLDTDSLERSRGITIFCKQAILPMKNMDVTLLDTPGHADFLAEAERALSVIDAAILVISAPDGIQSHTRTIWRMLASYNVPVFVFVNKTDMVHSDRASLIKELKGGLSDCCVDFGSYYGGADMQSAGKTPTHNGDSDCGSNLCKSDTLYEDIASLDEALTDKYLSGGKITDEDISALIYERKLFPVFSGSALKNEGIKEFIDALDRLLVDFKEIRAKMRAIDLHNSSGSSSSNSSSVGEPTGFGGRVFKISRDENEERLTNVKITSGTMSVRDTVNNEKITGIRIYDGPSYTQVKTAYPGQTVSLLGLKDTYEGQGLGVLTDDKNLSMTPVISYEIVLPENTDKTTAINKLMLLCDEQPDLKITRGENGQALSIALMGEIQTEIIKNMVSARFGFDIDFSDKKILYKETIDSKVEGVGHFEPLRHYAEVHLIMEPLDEGEGLIFETDVSEDVLDKNWQRLILTHLKEKTHLGVLTGSPITDMKITVAGGRAHIKHTEGGDFRQATYRAVRNGLMQADSHLLEPYYSFELLIPTENTGRAMTDLERLYAKDFTPSVKGDFTLLKGYAPVATLSSYAKEVAAYTKGLGSLSLSVSGYRKCHNGDEVIEKINYNAESDVKNTADSVFCEHGSSVIIPWNEVKDRMHVPSVLNPTKELTDEQIRLKAKIKTEISDSKFISAKEADKIVSDATSANRKPQFIPHKGINRKPTVNNKTPEEIKKSLGKPKEILPEYILVDGYNVIYADETLSSLARENIDAARLMLLDILSDYQAMRNVNVCAVFDAYRLINHPEEYVKYNNINVVYTKTAQTADYYIMRFAKENKTKYRIRVATSDYVEQVIVRGQDTTVVSSREFLKEISDYKKEFNERHGVK